jgi:serine/threonine-protein kinase HipA
MALTCQEGRGKAGLLCPGSSDIDLLGDHRVPALDYTAIMTAAQQLTRDHREILAMFRLMVFNVVAHNRDDHSKQFSFLMDPSGTWRVSPA